MRLLRDGGSLAALIFPDPASRVAQLKLALKFFFIMLLLFGLNSIIFLDNSYTLEIFTGMVIILMLYGFVSCDTTNIVAGMLLWTLTILASYQAWHSNGLYGTAIIIFPSLLIFANIFAGKLLAYSLISYMLLLFYFFAYAEHSGFIASSIKDSGSIFKKANNLSFMLLMSGLGIGLATRNAKLLIGNLIHNIKKNDDIQLAVNKLVLFDNLTGLPNEIECNKHVIRRVANSHEDNNVFAFIILELTNFEWIYASLGQTIADRIICYLADRLEILHTDHSRLYRSSNNEFIYLIEASDYDEISEYCQQLIQAIARPFPVESFDIEMTSAIGVSILPFDGDNYQKLKQKAHAALTQAKNSRPNSFKFFESEMEASISKRVKMVQELKKAIALQEFELYYQAKVAMADQSVVGAEALIRWHKPGAGIVSPLDFIPIAEESGLINEIGKWALEQACLDCQHWHTLGLGNLSVAVNLSPLQFQRGNLPSIVLRALHNSKLAPSFLELEITESLFIDDSDFIKEQVSQLSTKGVDIAIDDFGTGYSNLNYLTKFHARTLKVDMSFIKDMQQSTQKENLVAAIIKLSAMMALENTAEGIEDHATYMKLRDMKCQYGQGYYWSRPISNKDFIARVKHWDVNDFPKK
ncbi:MAG: GGDEF and EAL domain-containing protein [Bermanella sp.]